MASSRRAGEATADSISVSRDQKWVAYGTTEDAEIREKVVEVRDSIWDLSGILPDSYLPINVST